jgi:integrase
MFLKMGQLQSFFVTFLVRKSKSNSETHPIYFRLTLNSERIEVSTKERIQLDDWDLKRGCVKGKSIEVLKLNIILDRLREDAMEAYRDLKYNNISFTVNDIKDKMFGVKTQGKTLMELFDYHFEITKQTLAKSTHSHYITTNNLFKEFLKLNHKRNDLPISELNYRFLTDFESFIFNRNTRVERTIGHNAIVKHIVRLRKIVKIAMHNEWIDKDPFLKFKASYKKTNREYLTHDELQLIEEKEFKISRLQRIKDLFIFSAYTGLAYIDAQNLTQSNLSIGIDCEVWLKTNRAKTDSSVNLPILPQAMQIIRKYQTDPVVSHSGKLLPSISNMKFNAYLKEVADICGINKNLTSHMARHTFATTVTLTNGVPIETVSRMLGHSNIRTTQIYAKVVDSKVSNDMKNLKERLMSNTQNAIELRKRA